MTGWKTIIAAAGIGCILWGYYQLFAVDMEKALINKTVTALSIKGDIYGKAIAFRHGIAFISHDKTVEELPVQSIFKVDNTSLFEFETNRAVLAVVVSTAGGVAIWIALFFL
ncbi:MAG: hypothetical protein HQL08_06785 [Nitrospirae bacterium]|nr:hypothetical protein [Nitrospirota bacterium]